MSGPWGSTIADGILDEISTPPGWLFEGGPSGLFADLTGLGSGTSPVNWSSSASTPAISVVSGDHVLIGLSLSGMSCRESVGVPFRDCEVSGNDAGFPQSGPVFNLPAGWTANSIDGSVLNTILFPVLEPATGLLVMGGVLSLAAIRRRASASV